MNVPFGSILVWSLVMKMASMFCGRDLNTSLCQMMTGFIRIIFLFWCLFFFLGGGIAYVDGNLLELTTPRWWTFRFFRWLPTNPWNSSWESEMSGLMHLRTHILPRPKWPHENFWMSCLSFILVWQHSFENLWKPKHVQKCCFANWLNRFKPSTKTQKKNLHIFQSEKMWVKRNTESHLFSREKMIPLMTTFSPGVDRFFHEICFPVKHRGSAESGGERKI